MKTTFASLMIASTLAIAPTSFADDAPNPDLEFETARDIIWEKELSIYSGRGDGDLGPYISNLAEGYSAWPPHMSTPNSAEDMYVAAERMTEQTEEELEMEFVSFTLKGTTAIIYYQTHMTRNGDGEVVDNRYEVTHTWAYEDGAWMVLGGMARSRPDRD
ncbi:DUF4440 domain-containing protein [Ponticaulis sp.]|uniref:DUF4440 domain-containing protein n=1 Tax=Ponticaulis sp. TaxID=2020902 RepID=UPI000B63AB9D|nr:DUF4440 domain-containing protein [Ponticaulis sp.]MAJ07483.1 hypothetical protein [Ponticaulis sp.]RPG17715.1 MAG: nuclear transport factor 2 family protein [Hyphomonadaceae bacterium TMED125]HBH91478.1 hypothetical protein [Hyphomonadaceae bacterium]HBJ92932.1 hypothetical protein [Hyphomonadaceae bacterium]|tara:strand:- start:29342 stop:29821 length:480 start_codon:yes stop_codon:yes gene_type:complete